MKYDIKSLLYSLMAVGVFSAIGCSKSSELGLSLVEQEQSDILSTDTSTVRLTTLETVPNETYLLSRMTCGAYSDSEWGDSEASIYMNFRLTNTGASFPNAVFDSLVLTMAYENYGHYGEINVNKPTTNVQSWDVVRMGEEIVEGEPYTSDKTFITADVLKSGFQFTPNDTLNVTVDTIEYLPHLRIRLDDGAGIALGRELLNPQGTSATIYESNNNFKSWLKGIHIRPTVGFANNSVIRFKSRDPLTKLTLYYTDTSNSGSVRKTFEYLTNEDAEAVTAFSHNHPADLTDNTVTDTIVYLQGLDGLYTKIEFPHVGNLGNVVINKAELVVMVADTGTNEHPEPIQLIAKVKDLGGNLVFIDDIATSLIRTQSYLLFGGLIEKDPVTNMLLYRFHVAEEMQAMVKGTTFERAIYLTSPSSLDPERLKLINHQGVNKAKLYLTYTKLD